MGISPVNVPHVSLIQWVHGFMKHITPQEWDVERTYLRTKFTSGEITQATRKELERYLVVLANADERISNPRYKPETEAFGIVIRHLLQVRLGEELHWRSIKVSLLAVAISLIAAGFSGWQAFEKYQENTAAKSLPTPTSTNGQAHAP
jgi:hypothetical protein